jgi:hypothetical protein
MKTIQKTLLVEATNENIEIAFSEIKKYAAQKGYQIIGDMNMPRNIFGASKSLKFDSKTQQKVLRRYLTRINRKIGMEITNKFLHFLFKKIYKLDTSAPCVQYSEKELKIKNARKAWKKAAAEAEKLRVAYKAEKGDFYKK